MSGGKATGPDRGGTVGLDMKATRTERLLKLTSFLPVVLFLACWEALGRSGFMNLRIVPSPSLIASELYRLVMPTNEGVSILLVHIYRSGLRTLVGFLVGSILGLVLGVILGRSHICYRLLSPLITVMLPLPGYAWIPVFLIWFGPGDTAITLTIMLSALFPAAYNTTTGVRSTDKLLVWATRLMGASPVQMFFTVIVPAALPYIIAGMRIGMLNSLRSLVGAEMLASPYWGLGFMIYAAREFLDVKVMFAGLACLALFGLFVERVAMRAMEKGTVEKWGVLKQADISKF